MIEQVLEKVVTEVAADRRVALCALVATRGSTPQPVGTVVCVDEAAQMTGSIGGGCVEAEVRHAAHRLLAGGKAGVLTFQLDHDFGHDDGMICGGEMDVAVTVYGPNQSCEAIREALGSVRKGRATELPLRVRADAELVEYRLMLEPAPELVIAGGGHVGRILAELAVRVGFHVTVIDDREAFANAERFPPPMAAVAGDIADTLRNWPFGESSYVVIVTRGHRHDEAALRAVIEAPARYIGMIGSRRKIGVIFEDLRHEGVSDELLARVRAPIGLDIGAVTADEIALSIAAQMVAVRREKGVKTVSGPDPAGDDLQARRCDVPAPRE